MLAQPDSAPLVHDRLVLSWLDFFGARSSSTMDALRWCWLHASEEINNNHITRWTKSIDSKVLIQQESGSYVHKISMYSTTTQLPHKRSLSINTRCMVNTNVCLKIILLSLTSSTAINFVQVAEEFGQKKFSKKNIVRYYLTAIKQ